MIEEGVIALVKQAAPALAGRFYADTLPQTPVYPAGLIHSGIGGSTEPTFDTLGPARERYQFDFVGKKRADVASIRESVVLYLDGFQGLMPNGDSVAVIEYIGPISLPYDDNKQVYWAACEFYVRFNR